MQGAIIGIVAALVGLAIGAAAGYFYFQYRSRIMVDGAERQAERIIGQAETESKELLVQARDQVYQMRSEAEQESKQQCIDCQYLDSAPLVHRLSITAFASWFSHIRFHLLWSEACRRA